MIMSIEINLKVKINLQYTLHKYENVFYSYYFNFRRICIRNIIIDKMLKKKKKDYNMIILVI